MKAFWIASYPKSGNTWVHSVIRSAGLKHGFPPGDLDVYNLLRRNVPFPRCPCVSPSVTTDPCAVLKTHALYADDRQPHAEHGLETAGFVYLYRNPLDVLLSYINYSRIEYKNHAANPRYKDTLFRKLLGMSAPVEYEQWRNVKLEDIPRGNLDHALAAFGDDGLRLDALYKMSGSWIENTHSWIQASRRGKGLAIRYEDCLADRATFLKVLPCFSFSEQDLMEALDQVGRSVDKLRSSAEPSDGTIFYNKMRAYYFGELFSPAAIERFLSRHERLLRDCGYTELLEAQPNTPR